MRRLLRWYDLSQDGPLSMGTPLLALLLDRSADPRLRLHRVEGGCAWTASDDLFETDLLSEPRNSDFEFRHNHWLEQMDRTADERGWRRPDHLMLLRERGALTILDLSDKLGMQPNSRFEWAGTEWRPATIPPRR